MRGFICLVGMAMQTGIPKVAKLIKVALGTLGESLQAIKNAGSQASVIPP
jgi:hypothetical protein